jgi:hypothetical protein
MENFQNLPSLHKNVFSCSFFLRLIQFGLLYQLCIGWMAYKQQNFISHDPGGQNSEISMAWLQPDLSSGLQTAKFILCPHMADRERKN